MTRAPLRRLHAALLGVLVGSALILSACAPPGASQSASSERSATVQRGSLVASISATGNIEPEAQVRLSFQQPGTIAEIAFENGQRVKKGEVIARLDTTDLELALSQAQASLEQAKGAVRQAELAVETARVQQLIATANYSRTIAGGRASEIAAAKAALDAAQAQLDKLRAGPTPEELAAAEASLRNAEAALRQAQANYDRAFAFDPAGIGGSPAALQLEQATNNYNAAKAQYDRVAKGADEAQIKAAEQQVESARANLERVRAPARQFDIEQAKAQLAQAEIGLRNVEAQLANARNQVRLVEIQVKQAQRRIEQATLRSPIDGVIANLNVKVGETVGTQPIVTVVDTSLFHIDITVDEIDIAKVSEGQEVNITLDSLPGVTVKGKVKRISPVSRVVNGVVSYDVRVDIGETEAPLRSGMTANASIILERREDVLLVPNWAIRRDRESGKTFVTRRVGDQVSEVEVKLGLRNESFTEVVSGLNPGDVILAPRVGSVFGN
ncbi:MAG: efflux RND transporter periplasmic adaptor subunit [Thermoflexales bacterium]|nr:efflux RND transporter periplasmic adaptor subunit [Thermoflexales bacterium]